MFRIIDQRGNTSSAEVASDRRRLGTGSYCKAEGSFSANPASNGQFSEGLFWRKPMQSLNHPETRQSYNTAQPFRPVSGSDIQAAQNCFGRKDAMFYIEPSMILV